MRQYELAIRIAQVHHLVDERKYKKALAVIQTIDMRQVRSLGDLKAIAEVYTKTEQYEAAKVTYLRIYRRSRTRRVLYRLIYLSIRTNALEDAEAYYQEFVRMNPSARDALILRYRIDKASGVPIGQLIGILQELKQEEYIEEWAYELAKLYHRAGRREECMEECKDILLWFGTGEIVERAKILIDHLQEKDPIPYYDDKDFTIPKDEAPNPDDTGSLPDIKSFLKERKAEKKDEQRANRNTDKLHGDYSDFTDDYGEDGISAREKREEAEPIDKEDKWGDEENTQAFVDDYEEDDFGQDGLALPQMAKKLSGFLKLGKKEEEKPAEKILNQLLADGPEKMAEAGKRQAASIQKSSEKGPKKIAQSRSEKKPEQKQEKRPEKRAEMRQEKGLERRSKASPQDMFENAAQSPAGNKEIEYIPPHSQSGTGITQDLAKEISAIYEMEQKEQLKEKKVTVINEVPQKTAAPELEQSIKPEDDAVDRVVGPVKRVPVQAAEGEARPNNIATNVVNRMTQAIQKRTGKNYIPLDVEEIQKKEDEAVEPKESVKTEKPEDQDETAETGEIAGGAETTGRESVERVTQQGEKEDGDIERKETEELIKEADIEEAADIKESEEKKEQEDPLMEALDREVEQYYEEKAKKHNDMGMRQDSFIIPEQPQKSETEILKDLLDEEIQDPEPLEPQLEPSEPRESVELQEPEELQELEKSQKSEKLQEPEKSQEPTESPLKEYHAPDIPVVQTNYMEMPEITFEDLPTTRALQQSFQNVLKLIEGELDPSHFVLMGDGTDRIVGVSKQIVRIMKETGYLSQGRIAKINAEQLNSMDLITFRGQLKGNCLLIENASDLLFPTITKIFSIMEEYYGDFVVILADEGTTLDQLFRFVPALARKFKYIIDISKYTKEDYQ